MKYFKYVVHLIVAMHFSAASAGAYEDYFRAVEVDNAEGVRALLGRGFDPNTPDEKGQRGLFLALRVGSLEVARVLTERSDLQVDATNPHDETALMMAALRGLPDWVDRLIQRGAKADREGWTPLHYAAAGPSPQVVQSLLSRGVRVDTASPHGSTALMMAAQYGHEDSVRVLLAHGASAHQRDGRGATPADYARRGGREPLARLLEDRSR